MAAAAGAAALRRRVKIDIISDTICPWCYVGKRRMEKALKTFSPDKYQFEVKWHPFYLDPTLPVEGVDKMARYQAKFGPRVGAMFERMVSVGKDEGIQFDFHGLVANTLNSHRLVDYADKFGKQDEVVNRLFHAYFEEQKNLGDLDMLIQVAQEVGLPDAEAYLRSDRGAKEVLQEITANQTNRRVSGVPHFIFSTPEGLHYELSGAQPPEVFKEVIEELTAP